MRKLPIYLLLDVSSSMHGEPIEAVRNGLQVMISSLRQNPQAMDTAYLSVITFGSTANQIIPLTELEAFQIPSIKASGSTEMGAALKLLAERLDLEVKKTNRQTETKGDWKPLVFIMTDGSPTDDIKPGLEAFKKYKAGMVIACAAGPLANTKVLKQITEIVIRLDVADSATIGAFFKWLSASIGASVPKADGQEAVDLNDLPPPPPEILIV
jgi:uncharacterized protein YegL